MNIQNRIDEIIADREAYINNDCNGHDVNKRISALDMFDRELEDLCDRQENGEV